MKIDNIKTLRGSPDDVLYKIKSVMMGHAVGDALGVPVEFKSREELERDPVTDMRGYGTYDVPRGCWSDDTSMSLAALDALSREDWSWESVMDNFVSWLESGEYTPTGKSFDVGSTCLKAIKKYCENDFSAKDCGCDDEYSNGNGSLMRIHPFALYGYYAFLLNSEKNDGYWFWMAWLKRASELTHAHERSVMACYIYGYCLSFVLKDPTLKGLRAGIKFAGDDLNYLPEHEHFSRIFDPDFEKLAADEIKSTGYVVDTLEAALWCLLTTDSYEKCVLKAVNLGRDTDSVAAIAGGIAGAIYGYDSIPKEWLDALMRREYIENACRKARESWLGEDIPLSDER